MAGTPLHSQLMPTPLRIAHRGMPRLATENTLRSFELALEYGADGIELDVHASSDNVIVVHHDAAVASGAEIRSTPFARLASELPELPTLQSVCELVAGRAELFVEVKGEGIEQLVVATLAPYSGSVAIHSFDHDLIARLARSGTTHRLGVLVETAEDVVSLMGRAGAVDLWPEHELVSAALVEEVHATGGRVIPWTVNARSDIERVRAAGVDGICGDDIRDMATS